MLAVYLVLLLAAIAILGGVVVVAMGEGGELALGRRDLPPLPARLATAADVAGLLLPVSLFGYQEQATADALRLLAIRLEERDAEIARLRAEVTGAAGATDAQPAPQA